MFNLDIRKSKLVRDTSTYQSMPTPGMHCFSRCVMIMILGVTLIQCDSIMSNTNKCKYEIHLDWHQSFTRYLKATVCLMMTSNVINDLTVKPYLILSDGLLSSGRLVWIFSWQHGWCFNHDETTMCGLIIDIIILDGDNLNGYIVQILRRFIQNVNTDQKH